MATPRNRRPGIGNVGSFQVAGTPFLTGTATISNGTEFRIDFPAVTKNIKVFCTHADNSIRVHFDSKDDGSTISNKHFLTITSGSVDLGVKCKTIYISNASGGASSFELYAELTGIESEMMYDLTGPGINN
jgi:hypothetical protein